MSAVDKDEKDYTDSGGGDRVDKEWNGSPLDMREGLDHEGIREVVVEFSNGDSDVFRSKLRDEFYSYELHQMATYIDTIANSISKGQKR